VLGMKQDLMDEEEKEESPQIHKAHKEEKK
jgi:hypothetical protein